MPEQPSRVYLTGLLGSRSSTPSAISSWSFARMAAPSYLRKKEMNVEDRINKICIVFRVDETKLRTLINNGADLCSAIAELTGLPRYNVKKLMHGIMYSMPLDKLKDIVTSTEE